jgi:thiamine-monophosphate kinase
VLQNKISDYGEKKLIEQFIKPLFNPNNDLFGIGDDCAMIETNENEITLLSTDRVPSDLISFKLGLIDYYGLGNYLAQLNISDIVACGGKPVGLLLNFGLPSNLLIDDFQKLLNGVKNVIDKFDCKVLGGDITAAAEISISATSIGKVYKEKVLTRRNAKEGDFIFVSRPIGLTPTAFEYFCNLKPKGFSLTKSEEESLIKQFTDMYPLGELGQQLSNSGLCTTCIDNTDGLGQSLLELSQLSEVCMQVDNDKVLINPLVQKICSQTENILIQFAFGAGADFSLIGTLSGQRTEKEYLNIFSNQILIIGVVTKGQGVSLKKGNDISDLKFKGWNYFIA